VRAYFMLHTKCNFHLQKDWKTKIKICVNRRRKEIEVIRAGEKLDAIVMGRERPFSRKQPSTTISIRDLKSFISYHVAQCNAPCISTIPRCLAFNRGSIDETRGRASFGWKISMRRKMHVKIETRYATGCLFARALHALGARMCVEHGLAVELRREERPRRRSRSAKSRNDRGTISTSLSSSLVVSCILALPPPFIGSLPPSSTNPLSSPPTPSLSLSLSLSVCLSISVSVSVSVSVRAFAPAPHVPVRPSVCPSVHSRHPRRSRGSLQPAL